MAECLKKIFTRKMSKRKHSAGDLEIGSKDEYTGKDKTSVFFDNR